MPNRIASLNRGVWRSPGPPRDTRGSRYPKRRAKEFSPPRAKSSPKCECRRKTGVGDGLAVCVADFSATRDAVQRETRTGDVYQIGFCLQGALAWRGEDGCERTIESGQGWIHRVMPGSYESAFFRGQACRTVSVAASPHRLARALGEGGIGSFPQHELIAVTPELSDVLSRLRERPKAPARASSISKARRSRPWPSPSSRHPAQKG